MRRGEIWTAAGGVYASKPRPAVIIKTDRFADLDAVAVCPLTSESTLDVPLLRIAIEPSESNGLRKPSHVMIDRITTVRRTQIGERMGVLTREQMTQLERSLLLFLGIAG